MNKKPTLLEIENVRLKSPYIINDFIISNTQKGPMDDMISFNVPFVIDGITFCICKRGTTQVRVNYKEYTVDENSILTILPKQIIESLSNTDDLLLEVFSFSFDFISDFPFPKNMDMLRKVALNPVLHTSESNIQNLLRYHSFIAETFSNQNLLYLKETIQGLLYALLVELASMYMEDENISTRSKKSRAEEVTEQFMLLLLRGQSKERFVSFYANEMCITPKYLSDVVRKVTGRTANSWIEEVFILNAKMLLRSTSLTVLELSEELNFASPTYFGRFFKKVTGMTPLEYRGL
ncbi:MULTISPECIES: helix-turn-helix domain-containing protein [unclassified Dysgonomonas]|uniref:helix-turn-helix domain-containing protein n=1 Tax=unclassified Dysgonomonas TaxID=2630389 RepID=UPI0013EC031A|nr:MULTISPECIES: helix-turn-helix domain-containing protein [unclassified Dysgonomonas]